MKIQKIKMKKDLQVETRNQIILLLNKLNLNGIGAEIGVLTGEFSEEILKNSSLKRLYSIDCWKEFSPEEYKDATNKPQLKQYYYYLKTIKRLRKFKKRSIIWRKFSEDASKLFKDESLDFIYIDANHSYEGVKKDVELWFSKLKKGGIFAGHDYVKGNFIEGEFNVKDAVDEFVKKNKQKLFVTNTKEGIDAKWPSWYLIKK